MFTICKVKNKNEARECNEMLTLLIQDEANINENIDKNFKVENFYENYYQDETKALFIAKDEKNNIAGYIFLKEDINDKDTIVNKLGIIDALYVREEYRNSGIGTKLISLAKDWFRENNYKEASLNVLSSNKIAINLYNKEGFSEEYRKLSIKL